MSATTVGASDQLATPPVGPAPLVPEIKGGRWADVWRAISRNKKALAGVVLLLVFVVLAIFPGQIAPDDPTAQIYDPALSPSWHHLLGTTGRGEDVFSQLVWGTRLSLVIALAVGALATALSVLIGVSAAYLGARHCWETYRKKKREELTFKVTWIGFWMNIPGVTLDPTKVADEFYDNGFDVLMTGLDTPEATSSIWPHVHPRLLELVQSHQTTLIFCNARKTFSICFVKTSAGKCN